MPFRLVSSGGADVNPTFVNVAASGVINRGTAVDWVANGTGGAFVTPSGINTSQTIIFGVAQDYAQGASDTIVKVIPFNPAQLWEVDCANAVSTAQVGVRQYLSSASKGYIHNQTTDTPGQNRVFLPLAITGSTTGSGKLIGRFLASTGLGGI